MVYKRMAIHHRRFVVYNNTPKLWEELASASVWENAHVTSKVIFIVWTLIDNGYGTISPREIWHLLLNKKFNNLGAANKEGRQRVLHYLIGRKQSVHPVGIDLLKTESRLMDQFNKFVLFSNRINCSFRKQLDRLNPYDFPFFQLCTRV